MGKKSLAVPYCVQCRGFLAHEGIFVVSTHSGFGFRLTAATHCIAGMKKVTARGSPIPGLLLFASQKWKPKLNKVKQSQTANIPVNYSQSGDIWFSNPVVRKRLDSNIHCGVITRQFLVLVFCLLNANYLYNVKRREKHPCDFKTRQGRPR